MRKTAYFASEPREGWPDPKELQSYFLSPPGRRWFFETGNDGASLSLEGAFGTGRLGLDEGRIDVDLEMWGNPELGILLVYSRRTKHRSETHLSKGNMARLHECVRTLHDDPMPVGLYVPFETAWKAVKQFIETDGQLPTGIAWIASRDLPPDTFPDP
jgi:hypothetical protein